MADPVTVYGSELIWGIKNGELECVMSIVEKELFDVNGEVSGRPPILHAADYGQDDVIQYLLSKGANVNAKDKHGITALLAAIWEGHYKCVKLLLENGAEKEGFAPDGTSYLECTDNEEIKNLLRK